MSNNIDLSEIIVHEADKPNAVVDLLCPEFLTGQHGRDVDLLAIDACPSAVGDEDVAVMEGIVDLRQAEIGRGEEA